MRVAVLPAEGGSAATMSDAPRSIASQNIAARRDGMLPASSMSTMDSGTGGSQCQPHQLTG